MRGHQVEGPGRESQPSALPWERFALGVGPYLAVDALHEALAVLVALLELTYLLEFICGKVVEFLGDLRNSQRVVVSRLQGAKHAGTELRLAGGLLSLTEDLLGLLGGLLGNPQPLPGDLLGDLRTLLYNPLGGLQALIGCLLEGPNALLGGIEGGKEEALVGIGPPLDKGPKGLRRAQVVLGLLLQGLGTLSQPVLGEP